MIDTLVFTPVVGSAINLNTATLPIREWIATGDARMSERTKALMHALWPGYTYFGKMAIEQQGDILQDTPETLVTLRQSVIRGILGDLSVAPTQRKLGTLTAQYFGWTETATADVTIIGRPEAPFKGPGTTWCELMITWVLFTPYFLGASGTQYAP